jgi:hypothetical protein
VVTRWHLTVYRSFSSSGLGKSCVNEMSGIDSDDKYRSMCAATG